MLMSFDAEFAKANQAVHKVEDQWHYKYLTKYGWVAQTKEGVGFVRSYQYTNSKTDIIVECTTGSSCDYWRAFRLAENGIARVDVSTGYDGYWSSLETFLKTI